MNHKQRMQQLIEQLNEASRAYYQGQDEIMSNYEYDQLYDELAALEQSTGTILASSPTQHVGYEVVSELPKESHASPMLSLDKTKSVDELAAWMGDQKALLSWKMDGLTVVLTYEHGTLAKAVTRGNGLVGEIITNNARTFRNLPLTIPFQGNLILRGEAVIPYSRFEQINETLPAQEQYKNPRNLCSGTVRQLNNEITATRGVWFYAFSLVQADGVDFKNSQEQKFVFLKKQGFDVVDYQMVDASSIHPAVEQYAERITTNDFPSDGLVLLLDDIAYGRSLGTTAKFPRNAIAFKWADETSATTLREIEWSASRTGLINPVAIFDPVELEGTTVSRASVHNLSIVEQLRLGIGDTIEVYKANMIIPQIARNLTESGDLTLPERCPVCGQPVRIRQENDVKVLICPNPECPAKQIKAFALFVSRDAMNIDGLSESTLEKLIAHQCLHSLTDLYHLDRHRETILQMDGFGEKSCQKLFDAIEASRTTTPARFLYALGLPGVGVANAKLLCKAFDQSLERIRHADAKALTEVEGIGEVMAGDIVDYFMQESHQQLIDNLLAEIHLQTEDTPQTQSLDGMTFVITGSLEQFANRSALKEELERAGGKVTGSVTKKTTYLINNDTTSTSSKNKKAKELGIPILTEEEVIVLLKNNQQ